jgi:dTDP-4-dehydrorhamnose reductase
MKRVAVIGASSFIGRRVSRCLRAGPSPRAVTGTTHTACPGPGDARLDVTDTRALEAFLAEDFDFVLFLAGTKDLRRCEDDLEHAVALNARPVEAALRIVENRGLRTRLLYFSSDYVFDGAQGGYRVADPPAPRTNYGRSKVLAEELVLSARRPHKVVRSAAVMGRGGVFFDWLVRGLRSGGELRLFRDSHFSPTPIQLIAEVLDEILAEWDALPRLLHVVGERRMSRFDLGVLVAGLLSGCTTRLVPELGAGAGAPLFQRDLSLVPSEVVRRTPRPTLERYLALEVRAC